MERNDSLQPIQGKDRIQIIDVIRGMAIFGILLVNMAHFSYPDLYLSFVGDDNFFTQQWQLWDHVTHDVLYALVQSKFIMMFSFLFGFGMIIMMERAEAKGHKFVPLYLRRLFALLVFGTIHAFLIWDGDILTDYALLGFLLFLFRKRKPKTLIIWSISLLMLFGLSAVGMDVVSLSAQLELDMNLADDQVIETDRWTKEVEQNAKQALATYEGGSWMEIANQRIQDRMWYMSVNGMLSLNPLLYLLSNIPYFSMFLLGAAFAKLNIFHRPETHVRLLKRLWLTGLCVGLPLNIIGTMYGLTSPMLFGAPLLMFFYMTSLLFTFRSQLGQLVLNPLSAVGRTAFSNYIFQSVVCTLIYYNYGLGLYGKVYPFAGLGLTLIIFAAQVVISHLWLNYFNMGPLEWIWRLLTYGKLQPLRIRHLDSNGQQI